MRTSRPPGTTSAPAPFPTIQAGLPHHRFFLNNFRFTYELLPFVRSGITGFLLVFTQLNG